MNRRAALKAACGAALAPVALAGCSPFGDPLPQQWYRLDDPGALAPAAVRSAPKTSRVLLIEEATSGTLHEGSAMVFSRTPGVFARYRFATWTEAPVPRMGVLAARRLDARGYFPAVGISTSGLRGTLLLRLGIESMYHDATTSPGAARLAILAELLDWPQRTRLAIHVFEASVPLEHGDAQAMAAGMGQALAQVLDQLAPWVENAAASAGG